MTITVILSLVHIYEDDAETSELRMRIRSKVKCEAERETSRSWLRKWSKWF